MIASPPRLLTVFTALITSRNLTVSGYFFLGKARKRSVGAGAEGPHAGVQSLLGARAGSRPAAGSSRWRSTQVRSTAWLGGFVCPRCSLPPKPVTCRPAALLLSPPPAVPGHLRPRGRRPLRHAAPMTWPAALRRSPQAARGEQSTRRCSLVAMSHAERLLGALCIVKQNFYFILFGRRRGWVGFSMQQ